MRRLASRLTWWDTPRVSKVDGKLPLYYLCTSKHKTGARSCTTRYALPYEQITEALVGHSGRTSFAPKSSAAC